MTVAAGTDEAVTRTAGQIRRLGLEAPAVFFLEMQKPLARFYGHGLEMVRPLVPPAWRIKLGPLGHALSDPAQIEALIRALERRGSSGPGSP